MPITTSPKSVFHVNERFVNQNLPDIDKQQNTVNKMCGIAVAVDWPCAEAVVRQLAAGVIHRGDILDPVVSPRPGVAMCTRRLAIVDAAHGIQPQASPDGRILVSFNGEIYNHRELRAELIDLGECFKTESDTEVLAAALQRWGAQCLQRLVGMYAFVAIDSVSGAFLAGRDPFGVKPLYLVQAGEAYLFCSEIRPLLLATEHNDVLLLPPGYALTRGHCRRFADPLAPPRLPTQGIDLDRLLAAAIQRRLPPDLPTAVLFSGGVDSTLVAHYARRFRPDTVGYFLGGPGAPDYEYAARYAEQTRFDLRVIPFDLEAAASGDLIDAVISTTEAFEPSVVREGLCSYLLARAVNADGLRVALCGEGADELFCGYLPLELVFAEGRQLGDPVRAQCVALMHNTNLQRLDRCSMQFQLETREPFLDPEIVQYALSLEAEALVDVSRETPTGKLPLRQLYNRYPTELPHYIRDRKKTPLNEGTGFDVSQHESPWLTLAETEISNRDLADGKRQFAAFGVTTKEELFYIRKLCHRMDISRVPSLQNRSMIEFPQISRMEQIRPYIV